MSTTEQDVRDLIRRLLENGTEPNDGLALVRHLAESPSPATLDALVSAARTDALDEQVAYLIGGCIAEILIREDRLDDVPLYDFTSSAYLGYDDSVARHQLSEIRSSDLDR